MGALHNSSIFTVAPKVPLTTPKEYLAFSGGGAMAFAELGAAMALYDAGQLDNIQQDAGTSAGSMMALLWSLGYRGDDLLPMTVDQNFARFTSFDHPREVLSAVGNILGEKQGIFTGKCLQEWAQHAIAKRTGNPEMSFAEMQEWIDRATRYNDEDKKFFEAAYEQSIVRESALRERFENYSNESLPDGSKKPFMFDFNSPEELREYALEMRNLHVVSSCVTELPDGKTDFEEVRFSHKNPEMRDVSIAHAIEASASFPLVFAREKVNGKLFTDGGLTNNVPLEIFDEDGVANDKALVIAVRVGPKPPVTVDRTAEPIFPPNKMTETFHKFVEYRNTLAQVIPALKEWKKDQMEQRFKTHMDDETTDPKDIPRMILIDVKGVGPTDFNIGPDTKRSLMKQGYMTALAVLHENGMALNITEPPSFAGKNYNAPACVKVLAEAAKDEISAEGWLQDLTVTRAMQNGKPLLPAEQDPGSLAFQLTHGINTSTGMRR